LLKHNKLFSAIDGGLQKGSLDWGVGQLRSSPDLTKMTKSEVPVLLDALHILHLEFFQNKHEITSQPQLKALPVSDTGISIISN